MSIIIESGSPIIKPPMWAIDPGVIAYNATRMGLPMPIWLSVCWENGGNLVYDQTKQISNSNAVLDGPIWDNGVKLDGSDDKFYIADNDSFTPIKGLTVFAKLAVHTIPPVNNEGIVAHYIGRNVADGAINQRSWHLSVTTAAKIEAALSTDGTYNANYEAISTSGISVGETFTACSTWIAGGKLYTFLNGKQDGVSINTIASLHNCTYPVYIGNQFYPYGNVNDDDTIINATFKVIIIFAEGLNSSQVVTLSANPYGLVRQPEQIWKFRFSSSSSSSSSKSSSSSSSSKSSSSSSSSKSSSSSSSSRSSSSSSSFSSRSSSSSSSSFTSVWVWGKTNVQDPNSIDWNNATNGWDLGSDARIWLPGDGEGRVGFDIESVNAYGKTKKVLDTGRVWNHITITDTENPGGYRVLMRGQYNSFESDDVFPDWEEYTSPCNRNWRYIQLKVDYSSSSSSSRSSSSSSSSSFSSSLSSSSSSSNSRSSSSSSRSSSSSSRSSSSSSRSSSSRSSSSSFRSSSSSSSRSSSSSSRSSSSSSASKKSVTFDGDVVTFDGDAVRW